MPVAVVNGGTRGIGKAIADTLECNGWEVHATGRKTCDATDTFNVWAYLRSIPRVDLLVNVAGIYREKELIGESLMDFDIVFKTNFHGYRNWIQRVLPLMREQKSGYIINISSMAAKRVRPGCSVYAISKAAINTLTESTLKENLQYGIRATAICPGDCDTEIGRAIAPDAELIPVEDIAHTVMWLLSLSKTAIVPEVCIERRGRYL
jgi:NADP-dependent 3-hydroxy acid dehydrogenase YdfG